MEETHALYNACAEQLQSESRKKVMIVPENFLRDSASTDASGIRSSQAEASVGKCQDAQLQFLKFPHPATGSGTLWAFDSLNGEVYQLFQLQEKCCSWFVGNYVLEDGSFYSLVPVDPLFLAIPFLLKSKQKRLFQPVDQMLSDCLVNSPEYRTAVELLLRNDAVFLNEVDLICTMKNVHGNRFVKLCRRKLAAWLKIKVKYLSASLRREHVDVGTKIVTAGQTSITTDIEYSQEMYDKYAMGILGDYLPSLLRLEMTKALG
ncbi:ribonuclease H2 subunit B-like, partial [Paramacrobiotus metropolitanus]|uniref:ribonuclease H2 subunit B-like n=1 Tax=Paramacrobiotus metropolitanus TaxID=2943436 RepID=UPI0024464937